ncbi:Glutamyl-tRNA(Gln) amidotransferase subunit A [Candidatus Desulfarcum epimagneticum]|uniref:Glutamyl-tRNA(Gln) amidotransferase subunit A n=1 Tax=uncultured Desulfobacteraceae bacterium TaxID=218296 RepID=A0A484HNP2_9BACT|nr:Glutamyl-tRNA(Gln) amidotransferase subunit A [uncultured Desulfobacteraceae bacterium]
MNLWELGIAEALRLLKKKEISARELTSSVLGRIEEVEDRVGAYITVAGDMALEQAEKADGDIQNGRMKPLSGIPLALKDLICVKNLRTTCASKILSDFVPPYDAHVAQRLKDAGAVIVGKTNMDEFAMGSSTENSGIKITRNPWDLSRIPGGSSGGSAAAAAAGMCLGALGSDTGGSIRQPASHCGVVGVKPTYGRVSRFGLVAFASSLDQIGPMGRNVSDCALILNAIAGHDPKDSTSAPHDAPDHTSFFTKGLKGTVIGISKEYKDPEGLDPEVAAAVNQAVQLLESLGAKCVEVSLPHTRHAVAAYYVIAPSEASSNLARYDGIKYGFRDKDQTALMDMYRNTRSRGFGREVKRRIIIGTYCLSAGYYDAYYKKASQARTLIKADYEKAFETCDVIASPTAPTPALEIGEIVDDPLAMYLSDVFTLSANLAGVPGISVPCGFSSNGLPIGLQMTARHFNEGALFKTAWNLEQNSDFRARKPPL